MLKMFRRKNFVGNTYEELVEYKESYKDVHTPYLSPAFNMYCMICEEIERREAVMKLKEKLHGLVEKIAVV